MALMDDYRYWAARKKKADAMTPEVREQYREEYRNICTNLEACMIDLINEVILDVDRAREDALLQTAGALVAEAMVRGDADAFLQLLDQFRKIRDAGDSGVREVANE